MERQNRDPTYDLGRHIASGEKGPLSGDPAIRQYDAELDRNDPMDPAFSHVGDNFVLPVADLPSIDASQTAVINQRALGDSEGTHSNPIDMASASDCNDTPDKGGLAYGPRFMGKQGDY